MRNMAITMARNSKEMKSNSDLILFKIRIHLTKLKINRDYGGGLHSTGFKDFILKSEIQRAIAEAGFEHPSEGKF